MSSDIINSISEFYKHIKIASSEYAKRETFKTLLVRLYDKNPICSDIINQMDAGAEKTVFNIPIEHRKKTGRADTQYRNVIIEYESDLNNTEDHAKDQLVEYFAGNWNSGNEQEFILIATDTISWKVYNPDFEHLFGKEKIGKSDVVLNEKDSFRLSEKNFESFFYFIDHYLFRTYAQIPTYNTIKNDFGDSSATFLFSIKELYRYYNSVEDDSEMKIVYEQWHLFLSIAYGTFRGSKEVFLIHTYLSIFSKILAFLVISKKRYLTDEEMKEILKGNAFYEYNVSNFIEHDFFHWIAKDEHFINLKSVFRRIATQLSDYNLGTVDEDILKGIYQELIDIETRHALGEYYTPDWLADLILSELPINKTSKVLDPACGSGTFLRSVIIKMKNDFSDITYEELLSNVVGIDIHPLSVQIAKTTILLNIADKVVHLRKPITLQVYLANALLIPKDKANLFEEYFDVYINKKQYEISNQILEEPAFFDKAINLCDDLAKQDESKKALSEKEFKKISESRFETSLSQQIITSLYNIYLALKEAIELKENSIWSFILQNSYKPFFLQNKFDFVVGNPPWLPYRDMNNASYQDQLRKLASLYNLVPKYESITHLELASIFLSHASVNFLKDSGKVAFVLPRGFLSADHHMHTRNGTAQGFRIYEIWDLKDVNPLFRITSCVIFADRKIIDLDEKKVDLIYTDGEISGKVLSGRLPSNHLSISEASPCLEISGTNWFYSKLGKRTSFSTEKIILSSDSNFYQKKFTQGATLVPRNLYFVEPVQPETENYENKTLYVKTDENVKKNAKQPWNEVELKMLVNSDFLFKTALANNLLPFHLIAPILVHLPIEIGEEGYPILLSWRDIRHKGKIESSNWFKEVEKIWDSKKTEKSEKIKFYEWLNWQNKLSEQNLKYEYLVLYTASSKDANAALLKRSDIDLDFIVESKTYWFGTNNKKEGYYLVSYLNSYFANQKIKSFQSTGLFGYRDIHKKILELPLPEFDSKNELHKELAELGESCSNKAKIIVNKNGNEFSGHRLGKIRLLIRKILEKDISRIDYLLKKIFEG